MTANGQQPSMPEQPIEPAKHFVWWSTDKSVADGTPSVLACLEVVVAVVAYWAIAIYFETTTHLWVSICVAPLLLLRSEQSIALGARWFEFYRRRGNELGRLHVRTRLQSLEIWGSIATGLIASALVSYLLASEWLVEHESWSLYWRSAVVGFVALAAALALLAGAGASGAADEAAIAGAATAAAGAAAAGTAVVAGGAAGAVAAAGAAVVVVVAVAVDETTGAARTAVVAGVDLVAGLYALPGFLLGVWLRAIAIRFVATARFLRTGFWDIPTNFRQTLFVIDLRHPAELVPGYSGDFPNTSRGFFHGSPNDELSARLTNAGAYVVFFIPAYLYRLSIKSTCWLYLPLVYIATEQDLGMAPAHLIARLLKGGWEPWRRFLAYLTAIAFIVTTLAHLAVEELAAFFTNEIEHLMNKIGLLTNKIVPLTNKIISPIEFLFQFDFSGKWWQYCILASALITFWLWREAKDILVDIAHAHEAQTQAALARQIDRVKFMMRVRNVFTVALIAMIGVHAVLTYSPIERYLPAYILRGLDWFYGAYWFYGAQMPAPMVP